MIIKCHMLHCRLPLLVYPCRLPSWRSSPHRRQKREVCVLHRHHPSIPEVEQIVFLDTLRPLLLHLSHYLTLAGSPGPTQFFSHFSRSNYWPLMEADIAPTVRSCLHSAHNLPCFSIPKHSMRLFSAKKILESIEDYIMPPFPKTKAGNHFIVLIPDRITDLTQVVPLKRRTAHDVAKAFQSHWIFKYGVQKEVLP